MFKVATVNDWWDTTLNPKYSFLRRRGSYLKTIGYAYVISQILKYKPTKILEIGHATSPLFDLFGHECEIWGIDDEVDYIPGNKMDEFRKRHQNEHGTKFIIGKLGEVEGLPKSYFDMVCSVSVIEHIPLSKVDNVFSEINNILSPGGRVVGSYDIQYGTWTKSVFKAHENAGLTWLDEKATPIFNWNIKNACFEDGQHILQYYMHKAPEEKKAEYYLGNYVTVLAHAYKSRTQNNVGLRPKILLRPIQEMLWEFRRITSGLQVKMRGQ